MRSLFLLAWVLASGVFLGAGAALGADEGNSANSNNPLIIDLISEATTINNFVDLGAAGPSPGDTYTFSDEIFRENNPDEQVGEADGHCTLINPAVRRFTCTITTSLPDGDITTEGVLIFVPNTTSVGAVTGGTGAYRNARGEAKLTLGPVVGVPGARHNVVFSLILRP
jgi:allene oxide cyclase-like protein